MANDDSAPIPLERKALDDPYVQLWLDDLRAQVLTATRDAQSAEGNLTQASTSVGTLSSTLSDLTRQQISIESAPANLARQAERFNDQHSQLRATETAIPIDGTPFVFRIEFIYHDKLAIDFLVVKVQAAGAA